LFARLDVNNQPLAQGPLQLLDSYFNPQAIISTGLDPVIRGMLQDTQAAVDVVFVNDLRNYLFGPPGNGGLDLTAINIQRGRDHGLPGINMFRDNYELPPYTEWSQINPDPTVWQSLAATYQYIDDCDVYVCGLAETPYNSLSNVGETFHAVIQDQYHRLRDGDPFWYEADGYLSDEVESAVRQTTLAELISRNTNISTSQIPCFAMSLADGCGENITVPNPPQYDFLVTLVPTTPNNPLFGLENDITFAVDGLDGVTIYLQRGRNYTFFTQTSCNHAFYIATTPDVTVPPFAPAYTNVENQYSCLYQNPLVTLLVDETTPSALYYQCALHNFMGGNIVILNGTTYPTNITGIEAPTESTWPTTASQNTGSLTTNPPTTSSPINQMATSGSQISGTGIALAVLLPILVIIIILLSIALYSARRGNYKVQLESPSSSRRESTVELDRINNVVK